MKLNLRHILLSIVVAGSLSVAAQSEGSDEFPMPALPETFESPVDRANYVVTHFWDRVKLNTAINNREGFTDAFRRYMLETPMASADVTHESIDALIRKFEKDPKGMLELGLIAEATLYSPDAMMYSDDFYLPFATAVAKAKKIPSADKARFARQASILSACKVGAVAPDFKFTTLDGATHRLSDYAGRYVVLFINDPDCDDCALARVRMSVDSNINRFIDTGSLAVISIYPDRPDDEWRKAASAYNPKWVTGSSTEVDDILDMRSTPTIYYLNADMKILSKSISVQQLLDGFDRVNNKQQNR